MHELRTTQYEPRNANAEYECTSRQQWVCQFGSKERCRQPTHLWLLNISMYAADRDKRSPRALMTRYWMSNTSMMIIWEHPDNHSAVVAYEFIHISISVSNWRPSFSYRFLKLPQTRNTVTLNDVDIDDFHILSLITVYETSAYVDVLLDCKQNLILCTNIIVCSYVHS